MKLPVLSLTAFWKWFWFACAALSLKGPQFVEIVGVLQLPAAVHIASFCVGLAGLLLTLQIHPTPTPTPPAPPAPPLTGQRGFADTGVIVMLCSVAVVIGMCAAIACGPKTGPVVNDVGQVTLCVASAVLSQVQAGQTTFEDIALAVGSQCGDISATEVEAIIALLTGSSDAGTLPYDVAKTAQEPGMHAKLMAVRHKVSK